MRGENHMVASELEGEWRGVPDGQENETRRAYKIELG